MKEQIHPYGSSPLRSKPDYNQHKNASNNNMVLFNKNVNIFLKILESFQYGCVYTDGTVFTNLNDMNKKDGQYIYIQSPKEFWKRKIGMCHDASIFIDALLTKEHIFHKCFYIYSQQPPYYPTHSFIITYCNDNKYRIIDVFARKDCYYHESFNSIQKASKWRLKKWIQLDNDNKNNAHLFISEHMPYPKCDFLTFSQKIMNTFKQI